MSDWLHLRSRKATPLYSMTTSHQPYQFILGARDAARTQAAYDALSFDGTEHSVKIPPLELLSLRDVKAFADQTLEKLGSQKLDLLFLNASMIGAADERKDGRGRWCETFVVNHFSGLLLFFLPLYTSLSIYVFSFFLWVTGGSRFQG